MLCYIPIIGYSTVQSNESEFRQILRYFATFRRQPAIFLTKRNTAELSTNFRKRYCLDTFEISKLYANVSAKFGRQIEKIHEISKELFFEISKNASIFQSVFRSFEECSKFSRLS